MTALGLPGNIRRCFKPLPNIGSAAQSAHILAAARPAASRRPIKLFLGLEVVVDGLIGGLGLARHIADRDPLIPALGEQPRGRIGDDLRVRAFLRSRKPGVGHRPNIANFDSTKNLAHTLNYIHIAAAPPRGPAPPARKKEPS
jgi:hypothetical protein